MDRQTTLVDLFAASGIPVDLKRTVPVVPLSANSIQSRIRPSSPNSSSFDVLTAVAALDSVSDGALVQSLFALRGDEEIKPEGMTLTERAEKDGGPGVRDVESDAESETDEADEADEADEQEAEAGRSQNNQDDPDDHNSVTAALPSPVVPARKRKVPHVQVKAQPVKRAAKRTRQPEPVVPSDSASGSGGRRRVWEFVC